MIPMSTQKAAHLAKRDCESMLFLLLCELPIRASLGILVTSTNDSQLNPA
jgi:hypothetical protein